MSLEHADEAREALRSITSDPEHGPAALSDGKVTANLLRDLLPGAPREAGILIAAAESGLADKLRDDMRQGLDGETAIRLAATALGETSAFTPEACEWAARELALALGLSTSGGTVPPGDAAATQVPGPAASGPPAPGPTAPAQGLNPQDGGQQPPFPQSPTPPAGWSGAPTAAAGQGAWDQPGAAPAPQASPAWPGPGDYAGPATGYPQGARPAAEETATAMPSGLSPGQAGQRAPVRRRRVKLVLILTGALAVAVVTAIVIAVLWPPKPPTPGISITAASSTAVGGYVVTDYHDGSYADATISARLSRTSGGEQARLVGQQFPFRSRPVVIASRKITARDHRVTFRVTPSAATRYRIEVFAKPSDVTPLGVSAARTVYVTTSFTPDWAYATASCLAFACAHGKECTRPECHLRILIKTYAPPATMRTEAAKRLYFYFNRQLSAGQKAPNTPTTLYLQRVTTTTTTVAPNEYEQVVAIRFHVGNDAYSWRFESCIRDTLAADGLGLPGHHGCGDGVIQVPVKYLG